MTKRVSLTLTAALLVATAAAASAQTATPGIDARERNQQTRIQQGVASGQLTAREAANLERGQARVDRLEGRAKADGVVTAAERARINRAQNVESNKIYNKKHNARVAR